MQLEQLFGPIITCLGVDKAFCSLEHHPPSTVEYFVSIVACNMHCKVLLEYEEM